MKTAVAVLLPLISVVLGGLPRLTVTPLTQLQHQQTPEADHCPLCLTFSEKYLKIVADVIADSGTAGGCAGICALVEHEVHDKLVEAVCNVICDAAGITAFTVLIKDADLDPFYFCDLVRFCPEKEDGDAHIIHLVVDPKVVKNNASFEIEMLFETKHGTGWGQFDLTITTGNKVVKKDDSTEQPLNSGEWMATWRYPAEPDWTPGNYTATVSICYRECGSKHGTVYDQAKANFTVIA